MIASTTIRQTGAPPSAVARARLAAAALAALDEARLLALVGQADADVAGRMARTGRLTRRLVERAKARYDLPGPDEMLGRRALFERDRGAIERRVGLACLVRSHGAALPRATVQGMIERHGREDMAFALAHARLARPVAPPPEGAEGVAALGRAVLAEAGDPAERLLDRWRGVSAPAGQAEALVYAAQDRIGQDGIGAQRR